MDSTGGSNGRFDRTVSIAAPAQFSLGRRLGAGALGVVYEAVDRRSGAAIAVKTLHALEPEALYRLKREFRMLQRLQHPHLCQVHALVEHGGRWFVSMELVRGGDFLAFTRAGGAVDIPRLRHAWRQLAEGLCALHDAGLVHRDIKPSNVRVTPDGRVVVLDFGFVSEALDATTRSTTIVGTPAYMAPEQAIGSAVAAPADWYSAGVMVYEALTGRVPHGGETPLAVMVDKQQRQAPPPGDLVDGIPADLSRLCAELLAIDPARRPEGRQVLATLGAPTAPTAGSARSSSAPELPFVGRRAELAALGRVYADARHGRAASALVVGPSGVGKTALVQQLTRVASADGAVTLHGRCYQRESSPYKAFDGIVDALSRHLRGMPAVEVAGLIPQHLGALVRVFPVLAGVPGFRHALPLAVASDPQEQRSRAFAALGELCERLARLRPLVLVIEDWHWADRDSVLLARALVAGSERPPVLLVVTARPPDDAEATARLDAIAATASCRLDLDRLDGDDATALAHELLRALAPSTALDAAALAEEAHGHPLHIAELVRHVADHGTERWRDLRLEDTIAARVAALPPEARAVVEALAVAGVPLPDAIVCAAAGLTAPLFARQAALLRLDHLVGATQQDAALEPYHDRVRHAVIGAMGPAQQAAWHARIAAALEASPLVDERPELVVHHLEAAGHGSRAVELAITAAQRSEEASAFDQASRLYEVALRLGTFAPDRLRRLRIRLAESLANAGHSLAAASGFLAAAQDASPDQRLELRRQAAMQHLSSGDLEAGLTLLSELLAEHGMALPGSPRRALVAVAWGRARLWLRGRAVTVPPAGPVAPDVVRRLDALHAVSHGLSMLDNVRGADFNTRWLLGALRAGEPVRCAMALATEAVYLGSQGGKHIARARALVDEAGRVAAALDDAQLSAWHLVSRGTVEYWSCQLPAARSSLEAGEERWLAIPGVSWAFKNYARMFLVYALRQMGAWRELRQRLERYMAEAERCGDQYVLGSMRRYAAVVHLAVDDPDGARRLVDSVPWRALGESFHVQHWCELEARAEIGLYTRQLPEVAGHLDALFRGMRRSMLYRIHTMRISSYWLRARLLLAESEEAGDHRHQRRHAARLAAALGREGDPRATIAAQLVGAGLASAGDDTPGAVTLLRAAVATGTAHALRLLAAVAQHRLGTLVGGDEGADLLAASGATFAGQGVTSATRFAEQYAPGFGRRRLRSPSSPSTNR
jgi:hypothetical protein